jgi:hypothetical protein
VFAGWRVAMGDGCKKGTSGRGGCKWDCRSPLTEEVTRDERANERYWRASSG